MEFKDEENLLTTEEEDGASMVEYALLISLIAVVAIAAVTAVGGQVSNSFSNVANEFATASGS